MGLIIDDLIANIAGTVAAIWSMLPSIVQLFVAVALTGLMLGMFQAGLFFLSDNGIAPAQAIRATLTIGKLCDNQTGLCEMTWQPYYLSDNITRDFMRIDRNSTDIQERMDSCLYAQKMKAQESISASGNPLGGEIAAMTYTCACNASSYNFTGGFPPAPEIDCTGIPDGQIWATCDNAGLWCMNSIQSEIYAARGEELEDGFYLLDAQFWFLVGMLAPAGKFAMDWYSASKAMG